MAGWDSNLQRPLIFEKVSGGGQRMSSKLWHCSSEDARMKDRVRLTGSDGASEDGVDFLEKGPDGFVGFNCVMSGTSTRAKLGLCGHCSAGPTVKTLFRPAMGELQSHPDKTLLLLTSLQGGIR